ncbi:MAG: LytTR family DNA-binding domain-containing protein [Clostridia bacterium]
MKVAICDDQIEQLKLLKQAAVCYAHRRADLDMVISEYDNALVLLEELSQSGDCDVALLDICMPGMMGTDVAREMRQRKSQTEIIFITFSSEFAVDAFALGAAHYLIKPFAQAQFDEAMDRAVAHIAENRTKRIYFRAESGTIQSVNLSDILYIESSDHSQSVYLKDGTCTEARRSLARLLEELEKRSPGQFFCPYKGYIVNQASICAIEPEWILLSDGCKIPIPKRGFRELKKQYFDYLFRDGGAQ